METFAIADLIEISSSLYSAYKHTDFFSIVYIYLHLQVCQQDGFYPSSEAASSSCQIRILELCLTNCQTTVVQLDWRVWGAQINTYEHDFLYYMLNYLPIDEGR